MQREVRIGVLGLSRGRAFAKDQSSIGVSLAAVCDLNEEKLAKFAVEHPDVATYTDYDEFLTHEMDAVVVANYFHEHVPFAIKALRAGKHVMSETQACKTLQEGVELCREVERSGLIYMFAENCVYFASVQEMRRLYRDGVVGEVRYAEGEYTHPMPIEDSVRIAPGLGHWRNNMPPTYYCTHGLAPLMAVTDTMPVAVNTLSVESTPQRRAQSVKTSDPVSVILCRMDNGAVFRLLYGPLAGHRLYYRVQGFDGRLDNVDDHRVRLVRNAWELEGGEHEEVVSRARFGEQDEIANQAGHLGGDYWIAHHFAEAIRTGEQPYLDVHRAVSMSVVGILAWKSALENGAPFEVPDFSDEEVRKKYEDDDWSPWPEDRRAGQPWPSVSGELVPTPAAVARAEKIWQETGHAGL